MVELANFPDWKYFLWKKCSSLHVKKHGPLQLSGLLCCESIMSEWLNVADKPLCLCMVRFYLLLLTLFGHLFQFEPAHFPRKPLSLQTDRLQKQPRNQGRSRFQEKKKEQNTGDGRTCEIRWLAH
ncbi:UNVERIFIED_CONTAM: hypothetical protein K2H54_009478 [Gekko kuhli]